MYSAHRSIRAVVLLFLSGASGIPAYPQSANFLRKIVDTFPPPGLSNFPAPCARAALAKDVLPGASTEGRVVAHSSCDNLSPEVPAVKGCTFSSLDRKGCSVPKGPVEDELAAMGKPGQKILQARERVLEILQQENVCSAWYRERDPDPAATFQTLGYTLDRHGEDAVIESREEGNAVIFRNPYVARVFQADGPYARITVNLHGAFFSSMASVLETVRGGGPLTSRHPRVTNVGPYAGDTMRAQVLALLHEFGHVLDLLPEDGNNVDGKSVRNTNEVLRHCRAEIESKVKPNVLSAKR